MQRRTFVKLAAASPALLSPLYTGCSTVNAADAPETFVGTPSIDPRTGFTFYSPLSEAWYRAGAYFEWTSTTRNNEGRRVNVFYRTFGNPSNPALVIFHGYYWHSFAFRELISLLEQDYFVAILDFPGFGFSDKPQDRYSYMLEDDAKLMDYFVREIVGLTRFQFLTHDRGGSVGFAFLGNYLASEEKDYEITYHFISNGGLYQPLINFGGQIPFLDPARGPEVTRQRQAQPRVTQGTAVQVAEADILAFNDGIGARLHVAKYQLERSVKQYRWLDNLRKSPVPTALMWGIQDRANPVRIANHIWYNYLDKRAVESSYWMLPTGGHHPHLDVPEQMAGIIRTCLEVGIPAPEGENAFMRTLSQNSTRFSNANPSGSLTAETSPVFVGRTIVEDIYYDSDSRIDFPGAIEYSPDGYPF
jgi:pimeloyl-ACP methyl ester carboxylesterase